MWSSSFTFKTALGIGTALTVSLFAARLILRSRRRRKITMIIETILELNKPTVRIKDASKVEEKVCHLIEGGKNKLQIISDFDMTLTRFHYHGNRCATSYNILESSSLLPDFYREKAKEFKETYYPIEFDPSMSVEEKYPYMVEWWTKAHDILIQCDLNKSMIKDMVMDGNTRLRDGYDWMLEVLHKNNIPLLIFSAGIGDILEEVIRQQMVLYNNIKIVSNYMDFDQKGKLLGFKGELIHTFNKNEGAIHNSTYFDQLKDRDNVILMGDTMGDLGMAEGVHNAKTVLKIGFLNDKIDEWLPMYMEAFDIVVIDDQTLDVVNGILRKIL